MRNAAHFVFAQNQFSDVLDVIALPEISFRADPKNLQEAIAVLRELAAVFTEQPSDSACPASVFVPEQDTARPPDLEDKYRALVEQIPAVVFMAYLDRGVSEAYVSPEIEAALGYTREEWLDDPVRWYHRLHPDDKERWSTEAAEMFLTGRPLHSAYRVLARDGGAIWFQCDARMVRRPDGRPWFIHGIAFDISDLKRTEKQLQQERNLASAILETVDALVLVLDRQGRIIRFNRACELTTGYAFAEVRDKPIWDLMQAEEEADRFKAVCQAVEKGNISDNHFESYWIARDAAVRLIAWSTIVLPASGDAPACIVVSGMDITERKRLERTILEISAREQRRIGQDLHDGLGQQLTGIAFMAKVQQQKLAEKQLPEASEAAKIVGLVNNAISRTRELAKGLAPVVFDEHGLMSALEIHAAEVENLYGISCRFECDPPVLISASGVATHLYHIALEAVANAIKHGRAQNIVIRLSSADDRGALLIQDDGKGMTELPRHHGGMGLHIMDYRAQMIGGNLQVQSERAQGTRVNCKFPLSEKP